MNTETFKKFTEEARNVFLEALSQKETQNVISSIKENEDDCGTFEVVVSDESVDRQGEIVKVDGWDLKNYMNNPVVLWAHDYSLPPIGVVTECFVRGKQLIAKGKFAPASANPFAQQIRKLYDLKFQNTVSAGFIPTAYDRATSTSVKQELLEISFVPVPANANALRLNAMTISQFGINTEMLATKGIVIKTEEETTEEKKTETTETTTEDVKTEEEKPVVVENSDTVVEPKPEEKGMVTDELNENEIQEAKYNNLDEFFEIIWAFVDVYMDPATPVDQFETLVAEVIGLLQTPSNLNDDEVVKTLAIAKMFVANKNSGKLKAGRSISARNAEVIKSAIAELEKGMECHKNVSASLTEFLKGNGSDGDAEDTEEKTVSAKTEAPVVKETLDVLHDSRKVLVIAKDAIEEGISRYNSRIVAVEKEKRSKK